MRILKITKLDLTMTVITLNRLFFWHSFHCRLLEKLRVLEKKKLTKVFKKTANKQVKL